MQAASGLEREFLSYAVEQTHPFARECASASLRGNLLSSVRRDIERISSSEFAEWHGRGREFFGVPAAGFNNRLMDVGPIRLIAGIRFRNRDTSHPFVSVERSSIPCSAALPSMSQCASPPQSSGAPSPMRTCPCG